MGKIIKRGNANSKIRLLLNNKDITLDLSNVFFNKLPSNNIIRIRSDEYDYLPKVGQFLTHFNLQISNHKIGEIYLLPRIIELGHFDGKDEKLPLLIFTNIYYAKCIDVKENIRFEDLKENDFKFSFSTIKNVSQLKNMIIKRYSTSMPTLSKEKILSLGVSKTTLRIIGKD